MNQLTEAIKKRAHKDFDGKVHDNEDFESLFRKMDSNMKENLDMGQEIEGDLLSYNMLKNPKYLYLDKLKNILDYLKTKTADRKSVV